MNQSQLSDRLWDLAARVGKMVDALPDTKLGKHVAGQLVRCGTSSAPNYDESGAAESRDDFVHKLSAWEMRNFNSLNRRHLLILCKNGCAKRAPGCTTSV